MTARLPCAVMNDLGAYMQHVNKEADFDAALDKEKSTILRDKDRLRAIADTLIDDVFCMGEHSSALRQLLDLVVSELLIASHYSKPGIGRYPALCEVADSAIEQAALAAINEGGN